MEVVSLFSGDFPSQSFLVALVVTALCCFFAVRLKSKPSDGVGGTSFKTRDCNCACSCKLCGGVSDSVATATATMLERAPVVVVSAAAAAAGERQTGASMMEQLVPEITTHALSYLDYPSLCRLSMTNSLMRKAANDDNAWKALYHKVLLLPLQCLKDFTLEQDNIAPLNGWKAYYAATRTIVNVNAAFFNIIRERSIPAMGRLWLSADYVKCVHASGELFTGYNAVMESWQLAFNWEEHGIGFQVRDVRTRVLTDMAWVTMKTYVEMEADVFSMTNVFEFHNGQWYIVHHHSSLMLINGDGQQQIVQG
ncbi:F-box protein skip8 [Sarracenia purpurea var. burkii]